MAQLDDRTDRSPRLAVLAAGLATLFLLEAWAQTPLAASPAPQEGEEITLVLEGRQRPRLRLAFPALAVPEPLPGAVSAAAVELEGALRSDLEACRIFDIQGPDDLAVLQLTGETERDFELFRSLANEILLSGEVRSEEGKLVLEGRVYDLKSGQYIFGKRYKGGPDLVRRIAHTFADEIVLYFTGRRGIALTSIAFYSDRGGTKEVYLMDYDGSNPRPITGHKSISMSPEWSPRGDTIAYVSYYAGAPGIYLVALSSGKKSPLINDGTLNSSPSFSPDGTRVAFSRSLGGNPEIFACRVDGSGLQRLTHSAGIDTNPAWSPDGKEIAFTSSRAGSPHIYVMDAEGSNLRRATFEGGYNDGADWSPDGSRIAYASRRRGQNFDIVVTELALLETKVLTSGPGSHEAPTYSPDGRRIAFASRGGLLTGSSTQIFAMDSDGGHTVQLTREGNNLGPDWSSLSSH